MSKIQIDFNAANGVAINVANDVLPFWLMEVSPFCFYQSKSLLHAEIEWFYDAFKFIKCHFIRIALRSRRYMASSNRCRTGSLSGAR